MPAIVTSTNHRARPVASVAVTTKSVSHTAAVRAPEPQLDQRQQVGYIAISDRRGGAESHHRQHTLRSAAEGGAEVAVVSSSDPSANAIYSGTGRAA